jgi:hypothetical protein
MYALLMLATGNWNNKFIISGSLAILGKNKLCARIQLANLNLGQSYLDANKLDLRYIMKES